MLVLFCIMIELAPHALHHSTLSSYMTHISDRPRVHRAEPEVRVEQAQIEGLTNLVWIKVSPGASNYYP
jgi:hypothetical protein